MEKITSKSVVWSIVLLLPIYEALTDNRCYLENGASSESFFVPEDLPIGAPIGQIRLHGDPRPSGNIQLHLKETDSPITIVPGTKNLSLTRRLDKEGQEGPSSVFVNLICERLHAPDPVYVIPISIRVTDANDNAPQFINAPYVLNISEVTVVGTRVLQGVHAVDKDQPGPFSSIKYQVLIGPHSDYFEFENELEGTLVLKKPLDYETLNTFSIQIRAQDHGEPARRTDTILTVNVVDADDQNPKFQDERYTLILPEKVKRGQTLAIQPRDIWARDQDLGINAPVYYTFNGFGTDLFKINGQTGKINAIRDVFDLLHPLVLVVKATQQDNPDRYALATLTITKNQTSSIQFLNHVFYFRVAEDFPIGGVVGVLANNRPNQDLRYFVSNQNILKLFSINTKGEVMLKKKLDFEDKAEFVFKVFATDGVTNDSSIVNITVDDVNEWEPRFRYPHYEFYASGDTTNALIGRIEAADGDRNDKLTFTLTGTNATLFFITPNGELRLRENKSLRKGAANLAVVAADSGQPQKRASVPVTIHFPVDDNSTALFRSNTGAPMLLAGLGAILLLLVFVIALLIAYICKAQARRTLPTPLQPPQLKSTTLDRMSNPVFGDGLKSPTATAMGGVPSGTDLKPNRLTSPKVHPAPQPPLWPGASTRVKKLSWGDKTDSDSSENVHNPNSTPRLIDNTNLTVYF